MDKKKKTSVNKCRLCGSNRIHHAHDVGENMYSCSNEDCPLGQVTFTDEEWFEICPPVASHSSRLYREIRRKKLAERQIYFRPYVGQRGILNDAAAMRNITIGEFCRYFTMRAAMKIMNSEKHRARNEVIKAALQGDYDHLVKA